MLDNGSARTVVHKVGIVHKKDNVGPDLARTGNRRSILQIDRQIPEGDCLRGLGSRQCGKYTGRQRLGGGEAASVFRNVSLLHKSNLFRVPAVIFLPIGHFTTPALCRTLHKSRLPCLFTVHNTEPTFKENCL